jgi:diguanylate cyclase (GGDEF)-like protein
MNRDREPSSSPGTVNMDDLLPGFLSRTETRLASMATLLQQLASNPADRGSVNELARHFHALAGLGGTFGFPLVSEIAGRREAECKNVLAQNRTPSNDEIVGWNRAFDEIREAFASVSVPETAKPAVAHEVTARALLIGKLSLFTELARDLEREGIQTEIVASVAEVWPAIEARMPNVVIADAEMADAAAYKMVERLRSMQEANDCAAFLVGSVSQFADKVEAIRCGADGYFDLPLQREPLLRRIKQQLEQLRLSAPHVLYVEDDPDHASFVRAVLESAGYELRVCNQSAQFESDLISFRPDLVLMDVRLDGEVSGYDLARFMRQDDRYATTPLLFLTTEAEGDSRLKSIKAGGDDFLVKPAPPALLLMAVASRIERARMLKSLLERDGLTGLLTHSALLDRAKTALNDSQRSGNDQRALVMLDIDHFKNVNDRYGHATGDRVLAALGALLRRRLRQTDAIGRYGGEEFCIVLDHLSEAEAVTLIERLLAEFAAIEHPAPGGAKLSVTFSAGVAMVDPAGDLDSWKKRADDALYAAKRAGRNRVLAAGSPGSAAAIAVTVQ